MELAGRGFKCPNSINCLSLQYSLSKLTILHFMFESLLAHTRPCNKMGETTFDVQVGCHYGVS